MKTTVPVLQSTITPDYLSTLIQEKYPVIGEVQCELFRAAMNHLYKVTDAQDNYVFRVYTYNWRTRLEIEEELRLLLHLKENNTPVAYPIADSSGVFIQEIEAPEGIRYGVLFSYARGTKTARFSKEASFAIGKGLAKVHQVTENFSIDRTTYNNTVLLHESMQRLQKFFGRESEEIIFLQQLSNRLEAKFNEANETNLRRGVVHLDVWFDNMHIDETDAVTFFDFDFCGNGWLCLDVSYFLYQLFYTHPNVSEYEEKAAAFLQGYESEIIITDVEKELLPYACLSIIVYYLSIQCDRFEYWTNIFVNEDHLKRNVGVFKRWMVYHGVEV